MEIKDTYEVIIVGGGVAGLSAGLYCQRAAIRTVLFEKGLIGGQIAVSKEIENYPGVEGITGFDLAQKLLDHVRRFGLPIVEEEVASVQAGSDLHSVRLANGDLYRASALILASGGSVRKLAVPGEDEYLGRGVSYCAACDGTFFKGKTVVVVGGGEAAAEEALYLARLAKKVYLVLRRKEFRTSRALQGRVLAEPAIEVLRETLIREIRGDGNRVEAVRIETTASETRELATDGVFIFIGYQPNASLVPSEVRKSESGYVITDEKCETNIPGIYAVGDLRQKFANQIVIAAADGATAALGAAHYVETIKAAGNRSGRRRSG